MTKSIAELVLNELHAAARGKDPSDRSPASSHILLGPVVQRPLDSGDDTPEFYFAITGGSEKTPSTISIGGADRTLPEEFRQALLVDLVGQRPIVIHDLDDELEMARWAAAIWPCEQTQRILAAVRQECALEQAARGRA